MHFTDPWSSNSFTEDRSLPEVSLNLLGFETAIIMVQLLPRRSEILYLIARLECRKSKQFQPVKYGHFCDADSCVFLSSILHFSMGFDIPYPP